VRITSFRPRTDPKRGNVVTITVVARSVDDVQTFMESLEKTGAFRDMFTPSERSNEQGQLETAIETIYDPKAAVKPAAAPEPTGGPSR
jgi:Tfp pilus assembly protein PilN